MTDDASERPFNSMVWPDVPREVFGPGDDWHLNACVGSFSFGRGGAGPYLDGYIAAANAIYAGASTDRVSYPTDAVLFPLVFVWRHAIELALKEIIRLGAYVETGEVYAPPKKPNHDILDLWTKAKRHIIATNPDQPDHPWLANAEECIKRVDEVDPYADGFRFDMNRDQTAPTLADLPPLVNLRQAHEALQATANFLSAVRTELIGRADWVTEMRADYEAEMRAAYPGEREPGE